MTAPAGQRWHWTDVLILLATLAAALVLLHVISRGDSSIPLHPVACVQVPASDGRGMPACGGSVSGNADAAAAA